MSTQARPVKRKRLSYNLPAPDSRVQLELLALPPVNYPRHFDPRPLLFSAVTGDRIQGRSGSTTQVKARYDEAHPKHCLGVSALAIDVSTVVIPSNSRHGDDSIDDRRPTGLLYSAGRDGLMAAWELGLPTRRRKQRIGSNFQAKRARQERLTELGAYRDGESSLEDEDGFSSAPETDESDNDSINERPSRGSKPERRKSSLEAIPYEEQWQIDAAQINDHTPSPKAAFRQSVQPHSDWINDIVLCNMNRTVISASSDQTVRAWNPHKPTDSMQPAILGTHDDFVKCLAHSRQGNWVASGGFDRRIKIWDIEESREKPILDVPLASEQDSIYSLATNTRGNILASGSPSRIVRIWDPRQQQPEIARLRGHADNIRSLLVSEDGKVVLSASADSTIKLWSTSMQRCLHTFTYHNESVWTLFSNHPDLETFYSGDRSGLVCKVDLEGCGDMSEGECVVLCKDDDAASPSGSFGLSEGINSIVAVDDAFVWTATGSSSILQWKDIPPRRLRHQPARPALRNPVSSLLGHSFSAAPLLPEEDDEVPVEPVRTTSISDRRGVSFAPRLDDSDNESSPAQPQPIVVTPPAAPHHIRRSSSIKQSSLNQAFTQTAPVTDHDNQLDGIPLESLVCFALGIAYNSPFTPQAVMQRQQYAESLASLHSAVAQRWPHTPHSQNSFGTSRMNSRTLEDSAHYTSSKLLEYAQRDSAWDAVPLRLAAQDVIRGRQGLIRCEQLNDRRTVLTADTAGEVSVWDILTCSCLGTFSPQVLAELQPARSERPTTAERGRDVKELLELVRERIEGEGSTQAWSTVDVKAGSLTVHLDEARCFQAEVYVDDADLQILGPIETARFNPGKVMLRNIFDRFMESTVSKLTAPKPLDTPRGQRQPPPSHIVIPKHTAPMPLDLNLLTSQRKGSVTAGIALATPATTSVLPVPGTDLSKRATATEASLRNLRLDMPDSTAETPAERNGFDYFSQNSADKEASSVSSPTQSKASSGGKFMGKLKGLGRSNTTKKTGSSDPTDSQGSDPTSKVDANKAPLTEEELQLQQARELLSRPLHIPSLGEVPLLSGFPDKLVYAVSEQAKTSDTWSVVYRGQAETTDADETQVLAYTPFWVLQYLLAGRVPATEPLKITFLLQAWKDGTEQASLPEMPESHARLTANRILRMNKVSAFVLDKLDFFHQPVKPSGDLARNVSHTSLSSYSSVQSGGSTLKPMYANRNPEDIIELICNNVVLPHRATLAAVRQYCFKKSGDLVLSYRLRQNM